MLFYLNCYSFPRLTIQFLMKYVYFGVNQIRKSRNKEIDIPEFGNLGVTIWQMTIFLENSTFWKLYVLTTF